MIRAETDAQGATYEVHMKKADGSDVTVKLDANFKVDRHRQRLRLIAGPAYANFCTGLPLR